MIKKTSNIMEHVNHPKHYNQHPAGIECIEIIRHYVCDIANAIKYLWRAGLKPEMGKEDAEKEIEDLNKALWYIDDYRKNMSKTHKIEIPYASIFFKKTTGYDTDDVITPYDNNIAEALNCLFYIGIVRKGKVYAIDDSPYYMTLATNAIHHRIFSIEASLLNKEIEGTNAVLHGQAIEGEDYVSKPGCVRETEPEKYDPLNMILIWGRAYCLTDEVRKKKNGALYFPCENCDLWSQCHEWQDMPTPMLEESKCHFLCTRIHDANEQQYYKEVGTAKYHPKFGTIEVIDDMKEMQMDLKRMQEEIDNDNDDQ